MRNKATGDKKYSNSPSSEQFANETHENNKISKVYENEAIFDLKEVGPNEIAYELRSYPISDVAALWTIRYYEGSPIDLKGIVDFGKTIATKSQYSRQAEIKYPSTVVTMDAPNSFYGEKFKIHSTIIPIGLLPIIFTYDNELILQMGKGWCRCGYLDTVCYGDICREDCRPLTFARRCIQELAWRRLIREQCNFWCEIRATFATPCSLTQPSGPVL